MALLWRVLGILVKHRSKNAHTPREGQVAVQRDIAHLLRTALVRFLSSSLLLRSHWSVCEACSALSRIFAVCLGSRTLAVVIEFAAVRMQAAGGQEIQTGYAPQMGNPLTNREAVGDAPAKVQELLFSGSRSEAVALAIEHQLWPLAVMIACQLGALPDYHLDVPLVVRQVLTPPRANRSHIQARWLPALASTTEACCDLMPGVLLCRARGDAAGRVGDGNGHAGPGVCAAHLWPAVRSQLQRRCRRARWSRAR